MVNSFYRNLIAHGRNTMSDSWDRPLPIRVKDPWVSNRVMNGGHLLCGGLGKALHPNVCCQELSFVSPTGLQNGHTMSGARLQPGDGQGRQKKKRKKKTNRTVCSCGLASNIETERKDRMTLGSCLQCSFWWKESIKCKAESILHVGERTRANTSSILQFGKRKTGFLTTAVIHLLPVRMLHHIYTKCSFFYKKTPWAVNSEVYNPVGYTNKAIMAIALGETVSKTNNVFSSKQLRL